jgi:hypothetical protein
MFHVPAHKQTDPAKAPGQIVAGVKQRVIQMVVAQNRGGAAGVLDSSVVLKHTGFTRGTRSSIVADGGTASEREVGYATRTPFPLGGYIYKVRNAAGEVVYSGNRMSEGLAALASALA